MAKDKAIRETIDEVTERATIEFKRPLSLDETRELFAYIAHNLPCDFLYDVKSSERIYGLHKVGTDLSNKVVHIDISGSILCKNVAGVGGFECETSQKNPLKVETFKFIPIVGYEVEEHRPEVVGVWDSVREHITNYFKQKG